MKRKENTTRVPYQVLAPDDFLSAQDRFALDVSEGLSSSPKKMPSMYLYDEKGSRLYQKIADHPDYYPTRCELEILKKYRQRIASILPLKNMQLFELGAGDGGKTITLLDCMIQNGLKKYSPIDISLYAMDELVKKLDPWMSAFGFQVEGYVADYFSGLEHREKSGLVNMVLFLGSNIGNFEHQDCLRFLRRLWHILSPGDYLLIGFDLKKDPRTVERAYNDSDGITAEFNLNLLDRINRELGGNFILDQFAYHSRYNVVRGAVESWLVSRQRQTVRIEALKKNFLFEAWEGLLTEYSYKYLDSQIEHLAKETGYKLEARFQDSQGYFADYLWRVEKQDRQ
jgi:L-histidine Nalpha-methyltransferase